MVKNEKKTGGYVEIYSLHWTDVSSEWLQLVTSLEGQDWQEVRQTSIIEQSTNVNQIGCVVFPELKLSTKKIFIMIIIQL